MKIYNYSDTPIYWEGTPIDDPEVTLPENESFTFGTINYTDTQGDENVEVYYLYGTGSTLGAKWTHQSNDFESVLDYTVIFISCFFFCIMVKILQKLKTRG